MLAFLIQLPIDSFMDFGITIVLAGFFIFILEKVFNHFFFEGGNDDT